MKLQIFSHIMVNALENQSIAYLRDWLLPMPMSGQVKAG